MTDFKTLGIHILQDLHMGLTDNALMEKYHLSYTELRSLYKELFDKGMLRPAEETELVPLPERDARDRLSREVGRTGDSYPEDSAQLPDGRDTDTRSEERYHLDFDMPVYEADRPDVQGRVVDITETGAKLAGVPAEIGKATTFVALGDTFGDIAPFEFGARCRWLREEHDGECISGFEITEISEDGLRELKKLVQSIDLGI